MNKKIAQTLVARMEKALKAEFGDEFQVKIAGGRFDSVSFTPKLTIISGNKEDLIKSEMAKFHEVAHMLGLELDDFGRHFRTAHGEYKIVGVDMRKYKYPIIAERVGDRKRFKFNEDVVKVGLLG